MATLASGEQLDLDLVRRLLEALVSGEALQSSGDLEAGISVAFQIICILGGFA